MTPVQRRLVHLLIVATTLGLISQIPACGASARQKTLTTSLATVSAAGEAFEKWDEARQAEIVAGATSISDGQVKLAEYRAHRGQIEALFVVAYQAIAAASLDEDASLTAMLAALKNLADAIAGLQAPQAPLPADVREIDPPAPPAPPVSGP